jgi:hypothetical protein
MTTSQYFTTADGQEFYTKEAACNHAKSLKDSIVIPPHNKEAVEETELDAESSVSVEQKAKEKNN